MAELVYKETTLELRATADEVEDVRGLPEMEALATLLEYQLCNGWTLCEADELGALSNAPVLSEDIWTNDQGQYELPSGATFYAYLSYQVRSVLDDIERNGVAVFEACE